MQSVAPSSEPPKPSGVRRTLLIIGGAEDRIGRSVVLKRFIKLAGGRRSHIVVIPTASSLRRGGLRGLPRRLHPAARG